MELSMLQIKPIQEGDLPQLAKLFNNEYQHDQIDEEILYEKIFLELSFPAELNVKVTEGGRIIGFSSGLVREIQEKKTDWTKLFVMKDFRNLTERTMEFFRYMEDLLIKNNAGSIRIFDSFPNYLTPGVDPRHQKRRNNVNLTASLETQDFNTRDEEKKLLEKHGIRIKRIIDKEEPKTLFQFMEESFSLWIYEAKNSSRLDPIAIHIAKKGIQSLHFPPTMATIKNSDVWAHGCKCIL
ncbi:MAG: hypothetical protein DRP92_04555 [Candidatus Neomarinimicrobiota bacterium]|nr:MAG: hypothetical protein DRP92_04555 [Candidatus Neomarinimicrobiota bacterium]